MTTKNLLDSDCKSLAEVLEYAKNAQYEYIWAWQLEQIQLGRLDIINVNLEKLVEARIFSDGKEIHIFDFEDSWRAVEVKTDENTLYQDEIQVLKDEKKLVIRHYIDFDTESSQAYICGSCLNGWRE